MSSTATTREPATGVHGILAPAGRLDRWLLVVLVVLLAVSAVRYVDRHGLDAAGAAVLAGALVLGLAYATRPLLSGRAWWPTVWVVGMVVLWGVLTAVAPSFGTKTASPGWRPAQNSCAAAVPRARSYRTIAVAFRLTSPWLATA